MNNQRPLGRYPAMALTACLALPAATMAQTNDQSDPTDRPSSYMPVVIEEDFETIRQRMVEQKPEILQRHEDLLNERYELADDTGDVTMSGGKPVQQGVRVKLAEDMTWMDLANLSPDEIRKQGVFPKGFLPLPHPNHDEGGMVFP